MCSKSFCTVMKDAAAACTSVVVNMTMTLCYYWAEHTPTEEADGVVKQTSSFILSTIISPILPKGHWIKGRMVIPKQPTTRWKNNPGFWIVKSVTSAPTFELTLNDWTGTPAFQKQEVFCMEPVPRSLPSLVVTILLILFVEILVLT